MFQSKNRLILLISIIVASLVNVPRLVILLGRNEVAQDLGISASGFLIRFVLLFGASWLTLSFNMIWKYQWPRKPGPGGAKTAGFLINAAIVLLSSLLLTILLGQFADSFLEGKALFSMSLFMYAIVLGILWLIARLLSLNFQHQEELLEQERFKRESIRHQLEALRSQVNPHFLFNTLNSLNALIRQNSDKAPAFVDKLSWLLRFTLQSSEQDLISLREEVEFLEAYTFLQKERFGDKLQLIVDIPESWMNRMIPALSLQLLVENAIKHNVISSKSPLLIEVKGEAESIVVSNPLQARRDQVESTGKGLSNLSKRYKLLKKAEVEIQKIDGHFVVKLPMKEI